MATIQVTAVYKATVWDHRTNCSVLFFSSAVFISLPISFTDFEAKNPRSYERWFNPYSANVENMVSS